MDPNVKEQNMDVDTVEPNKNEPESESAGKNLLKRSNSAPMLVTTSGAVVSQTPPASSTSSSHRLSILS